MSVATDYFSDDGLVASALAGYESRPQQVEMADAVEAAFNSDEHLLVEAGTGVGKSFAYLIPTIVRVLSEGGRAVISTHTIALQEQLIEKDIPFLQSIVPQEFSAVLVKGRANYLGLRRLARASVKQDDLFSSKRMQDELHRIEQWAYQTDDGSLSDMPQQPDRSVWDRARSDGDDCLGRNCQHYSKCFFQQARREAGDAQLLIVNHALLFSDLAVRRRGGNILPGYDYVVLDEAHTIERVAGDHIGLSISSVQIHHLLNTMLNEKTGRGMLSSKWGKDAIPAVREARECVDAYFDDLANWHAAKGLSNGRLREPPPVDQGVSASFTELRDQLRVVREALDDEEDRSELAGMMERCKESADNIDHWHDQKSEDWVYWLTMGESMNRKGTPRVSLHARPLDIGPELKAALYDRVKSVVLTSATLTTSTDQPFAYLQGRIGLKEAKTLLLGSPFDYREQLTTYLEPQMPDPSDTAAYTSAACKAIDKYIRMSEGRAFVLFTSYRMLHECAERMAPFFEEQDWPLLVQGAGMPRSHMLETFREVERSVLFGTDSFWTGVDVPGESLSNVIIVKLPFAAPSEPMVEARIERIRETGGNPFFDFQVPEAVLKFRQGVGRLIRSRKDRGIIVVLDPRVRTKSYGKRFLEVLPECEVVTGV